jgi:hypothetical protein
VAATRAVVVEDLMPGQAGDLYAAVEPSLRRAGAQGFGREGWRPAPPVTAVGDAGVRVPEQSRDLLDAGAGGQARRVAGGAR